MFKWGSLLLTAGLVTFGAFSSSTNYKLNSYSVGPGATNSAASTTYKAQATVGEQANGSASSTTYSAKNGSVQTEQLNVPGAPTLSNGSNTYYNKLSVVVNTSNDPSDTTYAIAVSTNGFTTTNYVQASGTLGGSAVYQTYTAWGGSGGSFMTGLTPSTTYEVKVAAKEGLFTNTEYGAYTSVATASPSITFSLSPNSSNLGSFLPGSVVTSSSISFTYSTNAASGGNVYVSGQNSGLKSTRFSYTIPAVSANLASQPQGFGVQASGPTQTSGGPLALVSPYNGTGNNVGIESSTLVPILSTTAAIVGGTASANVQAKASISAPASNDYQEVLTFVASASF